MKKLISAGLLLVLVACTSPEPGDTDGTWVGTITTEGNVTTVVNESGSVWGGTATLVEEASIGVEAGADEYMLGSVWSVAADQEHIYVLDSQAPALRVYDLDGTHLFDIGAEGQGPGEYVQPDGLAVGLDGRIFVRVAQLQRINVYDRDGTSRASLSGPTRLFQGGALRATDDGVVYALARDSYVGFSNDGLEVDTIPELAFDEQPLTARTAGVPGGMSPSTLRVPFSPFSVSQLSPAGVLVSGFSSVYRINAAFPDGTITLIERAAEPVSLGGEERAWHEGFFRERLVGRGPVEGGVPSLPEVKPFFTRFITTHDGGIWVVRAGQGETQVDCAPFEAGELLLRQRPCWRDARIVDAFELAGGRYLGEVALPARLQTNPEPHIDGDQIVGVLEDEAGTIMVKRYRLVLPGEE